jgi:pimeloyl-ACP methyl ester carboxylesterase
MSDETGALSGVTKMNAIRVMWARAAIAWWITCVGAAPLLLGANLSGWWRPEGELLHESGHRTIWVFGTDGDLIEVREEDYRNADRIDFTGDRTCVVQTDDRVDGTGTREVPCGEQPEVRYIGIVSEDNSVKLTITIAGVSDSCVLGDMACDFFQTDWVGYFEGVYDSTKRVVGGTYVGNQDYYFHRCWKDDGSSFSEERTNIVQSGTFTITIHAIDFNIVDANMVSPSELGVGIKVRYPQDMPEDGWRKVKLWATINGEDVEKEFPVTQCKVAGEWCRIGLDNREHVAPTTPVRISLADSSVPRFTDNEKFDLHGVAYYEGGCQSEPDSMQVRIPSEPDSIQVRIPLPVVILHGYIDTWLHLVKRVGYPIPWWSGGAMVSYASAYKSLHDCLEHRGYIPDAEWDCAVDLIKKGYPTKAYKTLWDPHDFPWSMYSNPATSSSEEILSDVDQLLDKVWACSYADRVNFVGHSFGGLVARYYSFRNPERVNTVITVGGPHKGATQFFEVAFGEFSTFEDANRALTVKGGSYAGQECALLWTVPIYECLRNEDDAVIPVEQIRFRNSLRDVGKAEGIAYFSIFADEFKTPKYLKLKPNGGWYSIMGKEPIIGGDGYILEESTRFGWPLRVNSYEHAALCKSKDAQSWIVSILEGSLSGAMAIDEYAASWLRGRIESFQVISKSMSVKDGTPKTLFDLTWGGSDLDLILYDPLGRRISPEVAASDPNIGFAKGDTWKQYSINNPLGGNWVVQITAVDVPHEGEEYMAMVHLLAGTADAPDPPDGVAGVRTSTIVSWTSGPCAASHRVYFGTDLDDVTNGAFDAFKGTFTESSYDPGPLDICQTYYWRIDEVNEVQRQSPWKGKVWSFSTCCPDLDARSSINFGDFAHLGNEWLSGASDSQKQCTEPNWCEGADFDHNGRVDFADLLILALSWCQEGAEIPLGHSPEVVAQWAFDDATGTRASDSAGGNPGTVNGAAWTTGKIGGALWFDGVNDHVDCGNAAILAPEKMTVAFWMFVEGRNSYQYILGKTQDLYSKQDYTFSTGSDGKLEFAFGQAAGYRVAVKSKDALPLSQWLHVATTRDGNTASLYLSGQLAGSTTYSFAVTDKGRPLRMGAVGSPDPVGFFKGKIDDVRIYDTALSAEDVLALYQGELP